MSINALQLLQKDFLASAKKIITSLQNNQPADQLELSKFKELYLQIFKSYQDGTLTDDNYVDLYTIIFEIESGFSSFHIEDACNTYNEIIYNERMNVSDKT